MIKVLTYYQIDQQQWQALIDRSPYATWFQTPEAYEFYTSVSTELAPFAVGIEENGHLVGVIVGYTTQEKNPIKQLLTCRAIIIGGPLLANDISDEALSALLTSLTKLPSLQGGGGGRLLSANADTLAWSNPPYLSRGCILTVPQCRHIREA